MAEMGFQKAITLSHLANNDGLTSMEAFRHYGITRLAAVVFELKGDGWDIITVRTEANNRYGRPVWFATYKLSEADKARYKEANK